MNRRLFLFFCLALAFAGARPVAAQRLFSVEEQTKTVSDGKMRATDKALWYTRGGNLVIRKDDEPETVKNRLHVYHEQTEPLKNYYQNCGKLLTVEGQDEVADTTRLVLDTLERLQ